MIMKIMITIMCSCYACVSNLLINEYIQNYDHYSSIIGSADSMHSKLKGELAEIHTS